MRELFDDFNDIELDDNEIIERLMQEMEGEERRQQAPKRAGPVRKRRQRIDDRFDDDGDYGDFDGESDDDDDYDDYDGYDGDEFDEYSR